ncbi:hypothetical protein GCM10023085_37110 [Actinomadura viridis]|uniref:Hemoglobin-like flavoprotein n=1 Tax=Actinomadura viridis TaxID=58110 RepID=A0A931GPU5_9ACTN|nr:globin domain-containing protein [Actinomadura viridis]MBG6087754.1 hemoglobin-like flavoprotein [Actinomadura viridis]
MDPQRLKANFALVGEKGEDLVAYFYADLFRRAPHLRGAFPPSTARLQRKLLEALAHIVSLVDDPPALVPYLRDLGRRHGDLGVANEHYPRFGASLLAALAHFTGPGWNDDLESDWATVYSFAVQIMAEAASERVAEREAERAATVPRQDGPPRAENGGLERVAAGRTAAERGPGGFP